ncbi:MAG: aminotransferase class V-fold PLP-dependent enzyme, partial [Syntrophomonas sp.]
LDPQKMRDAIKSNTRLICMLHASNVIGTVMPIGEIGKIARENHILFMVDTAQTAGILSVDVVRDNIDILTFTGHKGLMGPQGTGGIYVGPELIIKPLKEGGTGSLSEFLEQPQVMPDLLESGTPNTPGIAGLLAGVEFIAATGQETIRSRECNLTDQLVRGLKEIKGVTVYGPGDSKQQTAVVAFNIEGVDCGDVCMRLDYEYGIVTRSGLHCAPLAHQTMGTLELGACRLSPGFFTTDDEIDKVLKAIYNIAK